MNTTHLKSQWHQLKGEARKRWAKVSQVDLDTVQGETERLVGKVQEAYSLKRKEAERQVDEWLESMIREKRGNPSRSDQSDEK